jgi:hypothetical protein
LIPFEDMANPQNSASEFSLEPLIFNIRGHRVILDADLANLYGSTTMAFNQALKRNLQRFPSDFAFQLVPEELKEVRSQIVIALSAEGNPSNQSRFATASQDRRNSRFLPWALTEHGALMAANILRNDKAVQMSIYVVRAFVKLRQQIHEDETMARRVTDIEWTLRRHDEALIDLYDHLEPLLKPPEEPKPGRRMGFAKD